MPSVRAGGAAGQLSVRVFVLHSATCLDYHVLIAAPVPQWDGFTISCPAAQPPSPPKANPIR
jgi:hypothetical protein